MKEEAQKELKEYMKSTMCSTYDLLEEVCIHDKPSHSNRKINEEEEEIGNNLDLSGVIEETKLEVCRIIPTAVCKKNLLCTTYKRCCHVFNGFIGRCEGCGEKFTTKNIWNDVKLWSSQNNDNSIHCYFEKDIELLCLRKK